MLLGQEVHVYLLTSFFNFQLDQRIKELEGKAPLFENGQKANCEFIYLITRADRTHCHGKRQIFGQ